MKLNYFLKFSILITFLCIALISSAQWTQIGANIDGEAYGDYSGASVSLSADGSIMAIGAYENYGSGNNSGYVRVFKSINGNWFQIGNDIEGENAGDLSGGSVSINANGNIVAIGATGNDDNGISSGQVRIFKSTNGNWSQIGNDIDGEADGDWFGEAISLSSSGNIVAIGARGNTGNGTNKGQVRIFENINGNWSLIGSAIDGETDEDYSGGSVSLSSDGSIVAIGATSNDGNGGGSGHVRIFENISGNWSQIGGDIDGENAGDGSGGSVAMSSNGNIVAIGAYYNNGGGFTSGHVRIFENINGSWTQIGNDIDGENAGDESGRSLAINSNGNIVAIGTPKNDDNGSNSGQVRIFENINGNWLQIGNDFNGEALEGKLGFSVSLNSDGNIVAFGAPQTNGNGNNSGQVKAFNYSCTAINNLDLGIDTTICGSNIFTLDAGEAVEYIWSTGDTTRNITVSTAGQYHVTVSAFDCYNSDSIQIDFHALPNISLAEDTIICHNDNINIDAGSFNSYLWNTGELTQIINVSDTGYYYVTVTNSACANTDSIHVGFYEFPYIDLPTDTFVYPNQDIILEVDDSFDSYLWSTGSINSIETIFYNDLSYNNNPISISISDPNCTLTHHFNIEKYRCQNFNVSIDTSQLEITNNSLLLCKEEIFYISSNSANFYQNNTSYSQGLSQLIYFWDFDDGNALVNGNNIPYQYPNSGAHQIELFALDTFNCRSTDHSLSSIYAVVSNDLFFNDLELANDTILLTDTVILNGTYNSIHPEDSIFYNDALFPIPDGAGIVYESEIYIGNISSITDIAQFKSICVNMEHSFMGDLNISLAGPNNCGSIVLHEISNGGGTFLGEPIDNESDSLGLGYDYCWNMQAAETWTIASAGVSTLPSGNYLPSDLNGFDNLLGCPTNGIWSLSVADYWNADNGFIFSWSIEFDNSIITNDPVNYTYWQGDNIDNINTDTTFTVPTNTGWQDYTYSIENEFGCIYDTTVSVYVDFNINIDEFETQDIMLYPNPASQKLTIQNGDYRGNPYQINIYNTVGKLLCTSDCKTSKTIINVQEWAEGIYIVAIEGQRIKFVKQ